MKQLQRNKLANISIAYVLAWIVGLSTGTPNISLNASGQQIAAAFTSHKTAGILQFIIAEGLTGLFLLLLVLGIARDSKAARATARTVFTVSGILVALLSMVMAVMGLILIVHIVPEGNMVTIAHWFDAINRLDGPKMWLLGLMALAAIKAFIALPPWHKLAGYFLAISLTVSGIAYGLLIQSLSWSVYVAGILLLIWVGALGIVKKD